MTVAWPGWCFIHATDEAEKQVSFAVTCLTGPCGCLQKTCDVENWVGVDVYSGAERRKRFSRKNVTERVECTWEYISPTHASSLPPLPSRKKEITLSKNVAQRFQKKINKVWLIKRGFFSEGGTGWSYMRPSISKSQLKAPLISSHWHFNTWVIHSPFLPSPEESPQIHVVRGPTLHSSAHCCCVNGCWNAVVALLFDAYEHTLCKHCTKSSSMK